MARLRSAGITAGQGTRYQFINKGQTITLMPPYRSDSPCRFVIHRVGIVRRLAVRVENDALWELFPFVFCHPNLAHGDDASGKIGNDGWIIIRRRQSTAVRIGHITGFGTPKWGHQ